MLSLTRSQPLLEASRCEVSNQLAETIRVGPFDIGQPRPRESLAAAEAAMRSFYDAADGHDNYLPDYLQCRAVHAAILMINPGPDLDWAEMVIFDNMREVWANCDFIIDRTDAQSDPIFRSLKSTLRGVEIEWQNNDEYALAGADDLRLAYSERLALIMDPGRYARRLPLVARIAELAGWQRSGTSADRPS